MLVNIGSCWWRLFPKDFVLYGGLWSAAAGVTICFRIDLHRDPNKLREWAQGDGQPEACHDYSHRGLAANATVTSLRIVTYTRSVMSRFNDYILTARQT